MGNACVAPPVERRVVYFEREVQCRSQDFNEYLPQAAAATPNQNSSQTSTPTATQSKEEGKKVASSPSNGHHTNGSTKTTTTATTTDNGGITPSESQTTSPTNAANGKPHRARVVSVTSPTHHARSTISASPQQQQQQQDQEVLNTKEEEQELCELCETLRSTVQRLRKVKHMSEKQLEAFKELSEELTQVEMRCGKLDPIRRGNMMVQKSWAQISKNLDEVSHLFVRNLNLYAPALAQLLYRGVDLQIQAKRLIQMLDSGISMLDKPDSFVPAMTQLGARHVLYGTRDEHYNSFREVLFVTIREGIGHANFTEELKGEWERVFALMRNIMEQGAHSPAGVAMQKRYKEKVGTQLQKTWEKIVELEGQTSPFFETWHAFAAESDPAKAELILRLSSRRRKFMEKFPKLFKAYMTDEELFHSMIKSIGAKHLTFGIGGDDYEHLAGDTLVRTIKFVLDDELTKDTELYWSSFLENVGFLMAKSASQGHSSFENANAPQEPPFAIIFTDIEASTQLWESNGDAMKAAVQKHHRIIRSLISDHDAYEIKTIGDSFMIACRSIASAILLCLRLQVEMQGAHWGEFRMTLNETEASGPEEILKKDSIRVRAGLHWCTLVTPQYDGVHAHYDYYGPDVNATARVESVACGGQTLITREALEALYSCAEFNQLVHYSLEVHEEEAFDASAEISRVQSMVSAASPRTPKTPKTPGSAGYKFPEEGDDSPALGTAESSPEGSMALSESQFQQRLANTPKPRSRRASLNKDDQKPLKSIFEATLFGKDVSLKGVADALDLYTVEPCTLKGRAFKKKF